MGPDRQHQAVSKPRGLPHQVEVTVRDGIERSWKKRGT
jgi:hypothetical protein